MKPLFRIFAIVSVPALLSGAVLVSGVSAQGPGGNWGGPWESILFAQQPPQPWANGAGSWASPGNPPPQPGTDNQAGGTMIGDPPPPAPAESTPTPAPSLPPPAMKDSVAAPSFNRQDENWAPDPLLCWNEDLSDVADTLLQSAVSSGVITWEQASWIKTHPIGSFLEQAVSNGLLTRAQVNWVYRLALSLGQCDVPPQWTNLPPAPPPSNAGQAAPPQWHSYQGIPPQPSRQ